MPIPIDDVPDARDQIPTLTPRMTTASDSLILSNILATIAREEVRYVGIVATDVLDVLFLTGMIRRTAPMCRWSFSARTSVITDPEFTLDFRGTIVGSSYPLDPIHRRWTYPFQGKQDRRLFVTDLDMGTYNAALVLLNAETSRDGKRLVVPEARGQSLLAYGLPFDRTARDQRPAMWINQVGQRKLWPLRVTPLDRNGTLALIPAVGQGLADPRSTPRSPTNPF